MKSYTLQQLLGTRVLNQAIEIMKTHAGIVATEELEKLIQENIESINEITGQENHPKYLAYVLQFRLENIV